jgi:uncharacterized secreted repeat protein (TIGR03808 family)
MTIDRRQFLCAAAGAVASVPSAAAPIGALGIDATHLGLRPDSPDDQTVALQRALAQAAGAPLALMPGVYRLSAIELPTRAKLVGVRGATRLLFTGGPSLLSARGTEYVTLSGLVLDGATKPLPERRGLVHLTDSRAVRITDCEVTASSRSGLWFETVGGEVSATTISAVAGAGIISFDGRGLLVAGNTLRGAGTNGIEIVRTSLGDDGTLVVDNRIEDIEALPGGSGQYGNAVNAFRAANVIVRGNRIRNCAFSAVRGNSASNIQIVGNSVSDVREVALYSEFAFEGAVIANNTVDGAAIGISVTNFNRGGRLAVVQGNLIRNLLPRRPAGTDPNDGAGIGIYVEADTAVTGNVVENAPTAGIKLGWGRHLRDVTVTGNVVRDADIGIAVSVADGAGMAVISDNLIAGARRGAILGMDYKNVVTGDLARDDAKRYAQLAISGNRVR